jgi:hypothetical protein
MMVKFRIGFTVEGETLFALMAKMLPIDDLHVEELTPPSARPAPSIPKVAQLVARAQTKPKRGWVRRSMDLDKGVNAVILRALADGKPQTALELKPLLKAAGFSVNSAGSRLAKLREKGIVFQPEMGLWQIKKPSP